MSGANESGLLWVWNRLGINGLVTSNRVDGGNHVLQAHVHREQVFTACRIQRIQDAELAYIHYRLSSPAPIGNRNDLPLESPIQVPLVIRQVLVIPHQFTRLRIKGNGGIRVQSIVVNAIDIYRIQ